MHESLCSLCGRKISHRSNDQGPHIPDALRGRKRFAGWFLMTREEELATRLRDTYLTAMRKDAWQLVARAAIRYLAQEGPRNAHDLDSRDHEQGPPPPAGEGVAR